MNPETWKFIEGAWQAYDGQARTKWGKLTDDDWEIIAGKRTELVGRIQERYGISKEEAEREADAWATREFERMGRAISPI